MFDAYTYLNDRLDQFPELKGVVRISGLSGLEELTDDIRAMQFPCVAVDIGTDGTLDLSTGSFVRSFHAFHVLIQPDGVTDARQRQAALQDAFGIGKDILRRMQADSHDFEAPCYGLEVDNIQYSGFGPIGMGCYGYSFNFVIAKE